jgi:hypothetical protein
LLLVPGVARRHVDMGILAAPAAPATAESCWLRGRGFDLVFIAGLAGGALAIGGTAVAVPALLAPIVAVNTWLLGYQHVVATYTRLCFDKASFREHRDLVVWLPLAVFSSVVIAATTFGLWSLATIYLYWQWWHYTRQSWGISEMYRRKAGAPWATTASGGFESTLNQGVVYLLPLWGILHRSHQAPALFLGAELKVIPVPAAAVHVAAAATVLAVVTWAVTRSRAWWRGELPMAHTLYLLSHLVMFGTSYLLIDDITTGWLVVNAWHNAQYVAFVWLYNNKRFNGAADRSAPFLSAISRNGRAWLFVATCLGISTALYLGMRFAVTGMAVSLIVYQTLNFHHYVVDSLIWKARRKPLQATLGLAG